MAIGSMPGNGLVVSRVVGAGFVTFVAVLVDGR